MYTTVNGLIYVGYQFLVLFIESPDYAFQYPKNEDCLSNVEKKYIIAKPHNCVIVTVVKSTKIGTHKNKVIQSFLFTNEASIPGLIVKNFSYKMCKVITERH